MQKNSFTFDELIACGKGELFGEGNAKLPLPPMLMFDRITQIDNKNGEFKKGIIKAELDIKDNLWFFNCHFKGDPVMPGCLGLDAMWQLVGFYLGWIGNPGKGRSNDLPEWTAWSDQDKYMILDSELDQGLIMSDDEITTSSIVSNIEKDTRLTLVEKCESLFALTYGEDLPKETFDGFRDGYCLSLDYSELLKRIENRGDDDD